MTFNIEPGVEKIAVLRANALGDFIFILPALDTLRLAYPEAEITLLGAPWHAGFLKDRPGPVDRVITVPPSKGVREEKDLKEDPAELEHFFELTSKERFDIALQVHGGGRYSNPFLLRLGARLTAGLKTPDAPPLDRWVPYIYYQPEILRYLEAVSLVGASTPALEPRLTVTAADLAESLDIVPEGAEPLAALHPGAGDPRRRWPTEKFAAVGDMLAGAGARILVTGTEPERELAYAVADAMQSEAHNLCGQLSLGGLAGLLSRCSIVVSNDSGPLHLAGAVGAPTVGVFWCGNLINAGPITRTRHRTAVSWRLNCPVCGTDCIQNTCSHTSSFVADVTVPEVAASALELLALSSAKTKVHRGPGTAP